MKPDDGYIAYIINPKSGAGSSTELVVRQFADYLKQSGFCVHTNFTKSLAHARELAMDAGEDIEVIHVPITELDEMLCRGEIDHSLVLASLHLFRLKGAAVDG